MKLPTKHDVNTVTVRQEQENKSGLLKYLFTELFLGQHM